MMYIFTLNCNFDVSNSTQNIEFNKKLSYNFLSQFYVIFSTQKPREPYRRRSVSDGLFFIMMDIIFKYIYLKTRIYTKI